MNEDGRMSVDSFEEVRARVRERAKDNPHGYILGTERSDSMLLLARVEELEAQAAVMRASVVALADNCRKHSLEYHHVTPCEVFAEAAAALAPDAGRRMLDRVERLRAVAVMGVDVLALLRDLKMDGTGRGRCFADALAALEDGDARS